MKQYGTSRLRTALAILCGSLAVILILLLWAALWSRQALAQIHYVEPTVSPSLISTLPEELSPTESLLSVQSAADAVLSGLSSNDGSTPIHILLIGQDRREGESRARSDAMVLCSFLRSDNRLVLTSFLRDLYVEIPDHQPDRLNAAYAYGGISLLKQTVEENFALSIDGCIEVDFSQFSQVVDTLGGVTIELRQDEAEAINEAVPGALTAGTQWLNGQQALAYTRIRNLDRDGDFSRTSRQRNVLTALLNRFQDASLLSILSTALDILPMLSTDMEQQQLVALAVRIFPMLSDARITSQRIPADGAFSYSTIRDMAVLVADMEAARRILEESLQTASPSPTD